MNLSSETREFQPSKSLKLNLDESQELLYHFVFQLVRQASPQQVLEEFKYLFFYYQKTSQNATAIEALFEIIFPYHKLIFLNTLKRCCYIIINNWEIERHNNFVIELINSFSKLKFERFALSFIKQRLNSWLQEFINSNDYQVLKLFAAKLETKEDHHWSKRYTSYFLASQYLDSQNSPEERRALQALSQKIKAKFRYDLAMYISHSQCLNSLKRNPPRYQNPTGLGHEVLSLIKVILVKRGRFNYQHLAHIFLHQVVDYNYRNFKLALSSYLYQNNLGTGFNSVIAQKLQEKLDLFNQENNDQPWNHKLLNKTCQFLFDLFLSEDGQKPSELFILLLAQDTPLTLVIILLKLILIYPSSRIYLESRIAMLIQYYLDDPERESDWVINFFEVLNISLAIYADRQVEYNLVDMNVHQNPNDSSIKTLDDYRVFARYRSSKSQKKLGK